MKKHVAYCVEHLEEVKAAVDDLQELIYPLSAKLPEGEYKASWQQVVGCVGLLKENVHSLEPVQGLAAKPDFREFLEDLPRKKQKGETSQDPPALQARKRHLDETRQLDQEDPRLKTKRSDESPLHPGPTECYCGSMFDSSEELGEHQLAVHPSKKNYVCSFCQKALSDFRACWKHVRNVHKHVYIHNCNVDGCTYGYNQGAYGNDEQAMVWSHMRLKHNLEPVIQCTQCGKGFSTWVGKDQHTCQVSHKPKTFRCPEEACTKKYSTQKALAEHQKEHQTPKPKHFCQFCGRGYGSTTALNLHLKIKHN